jgi:hypothetical protein
MRGLPDSAPRDKLESSLRRLWNGMRHLPYTNDEIAESAASVVALVAGGLQDLSNSAEVFAEIFGKPFIAGFAVEDGAGAHGYVSHQALWEGLRPDMYDILIFDYGELEELFSIIDDPRFMFEFSFLRERFVREVIPSQVAIGFDFTIFNPAKLTMFGNP